MSQSLWENRFEPERREYRYGASRNIVARVRAMSFSPNGLNIVFSDLAFGCLFPDDGGNAVGAQWDNDIGLSANDIAALPQRYFAQGAKRYSPSATANGGSVLSPVYGLKIRRAFARWINASHSNLP